MDRSPPVPVWVGPKLEKPRLSSDEAIRTGADRERCFGGRDSTVRILASHDGELQIGQEGRMGLAQCEHNRAGIDDLHVCNSSVSTAVAAAKARVGDPLEGRDHVFGVEGASVAEPKPALQGDRDLGGTRRAHALCQIRNHLQRSRINRHQRRE